MVLYNDRGERLNTLIPTEEDLRKHIKEGIWAIQMESSDYGVRADTLRGFYRVGSYYLKPDRLKQQYVNGIGYVYILGSLSLSRDIFVMDGLYMQYFTQVDRNDVLDLETYTGLFGYFTCVRRNTNNAITFAFRENSKSF